MAEKVLENLEDFLSMSEVFIGSGIFDEHELRKIVENRKKHEYQICKRHPQREDFLSYLKYDSSLLLLMNKRIKKLQFSHGEALISRQFERLHYMYNNYHKKFPSDLDIYDQHIYLCYKMNETYLFSQVLSEMLRKNFKNCEAWKIASKWYTINKDLTMSEKIYDKATTILNGDIKLWNAIIEFKCLQIVHKKTTDISKKIDLIIDIVHKALKACEYNTKLLNTVIQCTKNQLFHYNLILQLFECIYMAGHLTLEHLQVTLNHISCCPFELGKNLSDHVNTMQNILKKYLTSIKNIQKDDIIHAANTYSSSLLLLCENNFDDFNVKMIRENKNFLLTIFNENSHDCLNYPPSPNVAINTLNMFLLIINKSSFKNDELCNEFKITINEYLLLYPNCSPIWLIYLNHISDNLSLSSDLTLWNNALIKSNNNFEKNDLILAISHLFDRILFLKDLESEIDVIKKFIIELMELIHNKFPDVLNHYILCLLTSAKCRDLISMENICENVLTLVNINDMDVKLVDKIAQYFVFSISITSKQLSKNLPYVRRLYEHLVNKPSYQRDPTTVDIDKWLAYIQFEDRLYFDSRNQTTSMAMVTTLYNRAIKSLDSSLVGEFTSRFSLLKSMPKNNM